jgi:uncharacterized protein
VSTGDAPGDAWAEGWPPKGAGDACDRTPDGARPDRTDGGSKTPDPGAASDSDPLEPTVPKDYAGETIGRHPLFALPNAWLFPGAVMPLLVFEPRYVQMVEDLLDRSGRLVIGTVQTGWEHDMRGLPPVHPVAGLGEIGRHERRPDGRYVIVVVGLGRVLVDECQSDRLYRQVDVKKIADREFVTSESLRERLISAIGNLAPEAKDIDDQVPLGRLADFLLLRLSPGHEVLRQVYPELDEQRRAERVLEVYDARR